MEWRCSQCGQPVGDNDMVGYFTDQNNCYIPGTLGFWHCNPQCGRQAECSQGVIRPHDIHIKDFKSRMPQHLAYFNYQSNTEKFQHDMCVFMQRCLSSGYEEVYPYIDEAKDDGVVESNLPLNLLWDSEIQSILEWKRNR